ncbi:MAG: hypothetical protein IPM54_01215 [Polyangiaceae bacterium]|nr:hypothetical protein [Polyangiaceae bacterium]
MERRRDDFEGFGFLQEAKHGDSNGRAGYRAFGNRQDREPRYGVTMKLAGIVVADDYAPERVLSPIAMAEAHRMLGTSSLIAAMPQTRHDAGGSWRTRRISGDGAHESRGQGNHDRAGAAAVCDYSLFIRDGHIIGVNSQGY